MKRIGKSVGRTMKPAPFPELEKPVEEQKYARRMYGFHKNMNSPGFSLGSTQGPRRYLTKAIRELKRKQVHLVQAEIEHLRSLSPPQKITVVDGQLKPFATIDTEASRLQKVEESPKPSFSPLKKVGDSPKENLSSTLPFKARLTPTASMPNEVPVARRSVEPRTIERDLSYSPVTAPRRLSPISPNPRSPVTDLLAKYVSSSRKESHVVHELAALPCFQAPRITRQHPKLRLANPITGLVINPTTESPESKRGLGIYGSLVLNSSSGM